MTFGDKLREARLSKGYTQEDLAKLIGVAKSTLTGYEKGNREPDVVKLKRLAESLSVNANYLLGVEINPTPATTPDPYIPLVALGGGSDDIPQSERRVLVEADQQLEDEIMELRGRIITLIQRAPLDKQTGEMVLRMLRGLFYGDKPTRR